MTERITYKDAGVDIELADKVITSSAEKIKSTFRPEVIGKMGSFAAMFRPKWKDMADPVLVSATDGVGTKLKIAFMTGIHNTVGIDLVAMNVNDILVTGAEPLFFLDYFATGKIHEDTAKSVLHGIVEGCNQAGCALIGGETAEMPDFYPAGEYDLAGFCVGMVDKEKAIDGSKISPGNVLIGIASSGLHSNGFSLVRKVLLERRKYDLNHQFDELGKTLGQELITPTRIYVKPVLELLQSVPILGMAHITGGGFIGNIPRVLPSGLAVRIKKDSWQIPPIFELLQREAALDEEQMFLTFNMGIGFVMILDQTHVDEARRKLSTFDLSNWILGEIVHQAGSNKQVTFV